MNIKHDWFERQIEAIARTLAALLFGRDKVQKVFEEFEEKDGPDTTQKLDEMLLGVLINRYVRECKFLEAEKTLFSFLEKEKTLNMFMTAMSFYNRLLDLDDEKLKSGGFSKEKISQSMEKLKQIYKV